MKQSSKTNNNYEFYVVYVGRDVGIFTSWPEAQKQVNGYKGARHKGFHTISEAKQAFFNDQGE